MRVRILCEGQTEERFVKSVITPHLAGFGIHAEASLIRIDSRGRPGGGGTFGSWRKAIALQLRDRNPQLRFTTMLDLYGLPADFPSVDAIRNSSVPARERCRKAERELHNVFGDDRLVPHVQPHEFETLVLAVLATLRDVMPNEAQGRAVGILHKAVGHVPPEDVNGGINTHPSRRLESVPGYQKTLHGVAAITAAGLAPIRATCPHFDSWLTWLESLS